MGKKKNRSNVRKREENILWKLHEEFHGKMFFFKEMCWKKFYQEHKRESEKGNDKC